jgi:hypothetical protein
VKAFPWLLVLSTGLVSVAQCQLEPVDISGFGKSRPVEAVVTHITASECKGASYFQGGAVHYDDVSYTINLSAKMTFRNRSRKAVMLYRDADPALTQRVAASREGISSGSFVAGFDGDRMAISEPPKQVSIQDFVVLKPGDTYTIPVRTFVEASANPKKPLHVAGTYWVQLGVDARPDEFYFSSSAEENFNRKWRVKDELLQFVLSEPFAVEIRLDPNAPECKE